MTAKEKALRAIFPLPDDATIEQIMERLYVILKVEEGIKELDAGKVIDHAMVRRRLAGWLL
jgi:predicted transcriptional regulator